MNNEIDKIFEDVIVDPIIPSHPESILHHTSKGYKYYTQFQSYNRQFIDDSSDIVRWKHSVIEQTASGILNNWSIQKEKVSGRNNLFVWSSTDDYIAKRKKQVKEENGIDPNVQIPTESINNKLNKIIEIESNKFISQRIKVIREYHTKKMLEEIEVRKKNDYEMYLNRLKMKEDELKDKSQVNSTNFFGNLFKFNEEKKGLFTLFGKDKVETFDQPETLFEADFESTQLENDNLLDL